MVNQFAPGSSVIFRAYAIDTKTKKLVTAKDAKYFYVTIPNQPNVKLKYDPKAPGATAQMPWTGTWTVPASYPAGLVPFKVLAKTNSKRQGSFEQMPVTSAMLTIAAKPQTSPANGPAASTSAVSSPDIGLYVDTVNGTQPVGAPKRPVGCTQTNVYKRGEQFVLRAWGTDLATGDVLSTDNVKEAHFSIPGQADVALNWGLHGATGAKVYFWTNFWNIPSDYPLGETTVHVVFTLESGKTGTYDHVITIIP
jgi:hypothetical protein